MAVGTGKIRAQLNLPEGTTETMDKVMRRIIEESRREGLEPPFLDRGTFVGWITAKLEYIMEAEAEAKKLFEAAKQDREEARRILGGAAEELARKREELAKAEQDLMEADAELRRQTGLSKWALGLLSELGAQGMSRDDVLAVARVIKASGMDPDQVAKAMERLDVPGLAEWARRIQEATTKAADEYRVLAEENASLKASIQELQRRAQEYVGTIQRAREEAQGALAMAERMRRTAEDLGIYLQAIGSTGMRLQDMPQELGRVIAGVILLASVDAYGDQVLHLPADSAVGRLLPGDVLLSEIPYLLAPKEAYRRMQEAQARVAEKAAGYAGTGLANGSAAKETEEDYLAPKM